MEKRLTTDFDTYCKNTSLKCKIIKNINEIRKLKSKEKNS